MTRAELIREIRRLRTDATAAYLNIEKAIESGELPKSAKGTFFYSTYETFKQPKRTGIRKSNRYLTGGLTKLKKKDLEVWLYRIRGLTSADTATQAGIKNRLQEMEDSARALLESAGISSKGYSREDLSYYFQTVNLLKEMAHLPSDEAIEITNKLREENESYTLEDILNKVKNSDFDPRIAAKDSERWRWKLETW